MAQLDDIDVVASDDTCMTLREAGIAWEAGEFSDWVSAHGLPLMIGAVTVDRWNLIEDALADAAVAAGGWD